MASRESVIVRTSVIGILANVLLAGFKAAVGLITRSVAVVMDAVNNLSDAISSVVTIIGIKLGSKKPDKKHPMGHGRWEYLSATVIGFIILYAGMTALIESVKKIIHPETPEYSTASMVILVVAVAVKIVLGLYVRSTGRKVNSDALQASGVDALTDSIVSASTIVAALIFMVTGVSLEAWLGALISILIIQSGIETLIEAVNLILGKRADRETSLAVRHAINEVDGVLGAHDLLLHNYGPDRYAASVHIEVDERLTATEIADITRRIEANVVEKTGVIMMGVSIYSINTEDPEALDALKRVKEICETEEHVLSTHAFHLDREAKVIRFDAVIDFEAKDRAEVLASLTEKVKAAFPDYTPMIVMDSDLSD